MRFIFNTKTPKALKKNQYKMSKVNDTSANTSIWRVMEKGQMAIDTFYFLD